MSCFGVIIPIANCQTAYTLRQHWRHINGGIGTKKAYQVKNAKAEIWLIEIFQAKTKKDEFTKLRVTLI